MAAGVNGCRKRELGAACSARSARHKQWQVEGGSHDVYITVYRFVQESRSSPTAMLLAKLPDRCLAALSLAYRTAGE